MAKNSGNIFGAAKLERLSRTYQDSELISRRTYNLLMGGVVAYGLAMNILICKMFPYAAYQINPIMLLIGYVVCVIAGVVIAHKSDNPLISFLGYNLIVLPVGILLTSIIANYGGLNSQIVIQAFVYTLGITVIMTAAGACFPDFFSKLGGVLFVALIGLFICQIISVILHWNGRYLDIAGAGIFSMYIGYDFYCSQQYAPTLDNAVDCALDIYLDIINLFIRILEILGKKD